ncbi:MAG: cyanophycinase [Acidobacteriota bacterium]
MKRAIALVLGCLVPAIAFTEQGVQRGHLILVGGGDKPPEAMRKFVELAGGPEAPIAVVPTASEEADTGEYYVKLFGEEHGCRRVTVLPIKTREDAMSAELAELAAGAKGIFFAGGDQNRVTKALLDTPVGAAVAAAYRAGAVVGGTSAGTACQSALMITGEGDFKVVRAGAVELARGLGFFRGVIVDQHFVARQRSNRLLSAILEHPDLLGVGVDEDTAIWVRPGGDFTVIGERSVVVLDAAGAQVRRGKGGAGEGLLGVTGLAVHVLLPGETFDVAKRAPIPHAVPAPAR